MTVVPDENLMTLICDTCGAVTTGPTCVLPDAEVVWTFVSEHGWSGSPFATGPHRCPSCSLVPPDSTGPSEGTRRRDHGPGGARAVDSFDDVEDVATCGEDPDEPLRKALSNAVDLGGQVIVDLAGVNVIDSAGLGLLVRAHREARQRGAVLCLAAPSRFIRTVLHTMHLEQAFPIFATAAEARAASSTTGDTGRQAVHVTP